MNNNEIINKIFHQNILNTRHNAVLKRGGAQKLCSLRSLIFGMKNKFYLFLTAFFTVAILGAVMGTVLASSNNSENNNGPARKIVVFEKWFVNSLAKDKLIKKSDRK